MKKILIFGTYPIARPQHGGQLRVSAIVDQYKESGHRVKYVGIYDKTFYEDYGSNDILLVPQQSQVVLDGYISDIRAGKETWDNNSVRAKIIAAIHDFQPNVIQIEQAFPYLGIKKIIENTGWKGVLIYSSHNVEYELKDSILATDKRIDNAIRQQTVDAIKQLEQELLQAADFTIVCTDADKKKYKKIAPETSYILAPNGISARKVIIDKVHTLAKSYETKGVNKVIVYVGSAHPPNLTGFEDMIGYGTAFLPGNSKLVIIGGVSDLLWGALQQQPNYMQVAFEKRVEFLGKVSDDELAAYLSLADTIVLPITEGGGSNLKTAEAILSGAKIVATSHAFRSYERYEKLPGFWFANTQEEFREAICSALDSPAINRNEADRKLASGVEWKNTLSAVAEIFK